jgi:hypothetical protein
MMFVLVFFLGFSWAIWYVGYSRLNDQLRLLRTERAKELAELDQRVKQLESRDWSKDTLRKEVDFLKRRVRDLQFPLTEEERIKFEETREERERIAEQTGCDPRDVILTFDDWKRHHFDDSYFANRKKTVADLPHEEALHPPSEVE